MEVKKFSEYSVDEKTQFLLHWFHYYGQGFVNLDELEKFHELVENNPDGVYCAAVAAYITGVSTKHLLDAIRAGKTETFLDNMTALTKKEKFRDMLDEVENDFVEEVVGTYNNPEPSAPVDAEKLVDMLLEHLMPKSKVTDEEVFLLLKDILADDRDTEEEYRTDPNNISVSGMIKRAFISKEKLAGNRNRIVELFNKVGYQEGYTSPMVLACDCDGNVWTDNILTLDALVILGISGGLLETAIMEQHIGPGIVKGVSVRRIGEAIRKDDFQEKEEAPQYTKKPIDNKKDE